MCFRAETFLVRSLDQILNRKKLCAIIGVKLLNACKDELVVVALMRNSFRGLQCLLSLPVTDWVLRESNVVKPSQTGV